MPKLSRQEIDNRVFEALKLEEEIRSQAEESVRKMQTSFRKWKALILDDATVQRAYINTLGGTDPHVVHDDLKDLIKENRETMSHFVQAA